MFEDKRFKNCWRRPWAPRNSIGTFVDRLLLTDAGLLGYIHGCILTKCLNPNLLFVESVNLSGIWYWYICYKWNTFGEIGVSKYTKPKERLRFESGFLKVNQWSLFRCLLFWHFFDSTWRSIFMYARSCLDPGKSCVQHDLTQWLS